MKTIFQKFGLFAAMLLIVKSAFAYDFEADKLYFSLISLPERTCKLTTGDNTYQGELQIPEKVTYAGLELTVTELDPNAFNSKITGLTIPASITVIPEASVSKCSLTKLIINDSKTGLTIKDRVKKVITYTHLHMGNRLNMSILVATLTVIALTTKSR